MLDDFEIQQEFTDNCKYAHDYWSPFQKDAQVYTLAASGYTWTTGERQQLVKDGREPLEFNIMRRPIQFYSGYLRDNAKSVVITPVEGSDQKTSDQLDAVSKYVWDKSDGFPVFLDSCDEAFKSGISLCGIRVDYSKDFINGDIAFYIRTYNSFYLDPTFSNINLSDCGFCIMRDPLNKNTVKSLLKDIPPKEIDQIAEYSGFKDDKFLSFRPDFTTFVKNKNLIMYDQYYRRTTRNRKMLIDKRSGFYRDITEREDKEVELLEIGANRFRILREEARAVGADDTDIPDIEIRTVERPFIELNVMLNGQRVYCGVDNTGISEMYPFAPNICYLEPSIWMASQRVQGIAATQWSMQRQFNKRHMKIIDMMDSAISTGYKYLIGAVHDPDELQQTGQNKIIGVNQEDNPAGLDAVQELKGGGANPALIEYQKVLDELSLTLANINESVLGIDEGGNTQVSGRLAQVRIAQGLRSNRKVLDNIEISQQILGRLVLQGIQNLYPPEKIERILNEKPTQQFYDKSFEQYDAVVKEGVRSKTQKDAYYYEIVNLAREGIVDVPQTEIIRALGMAGLSNLEEAIAAQEEKKAEQQAKIDAQEQMNLHLQASEIESKTGLAQERRARVISDVALSNERASEAEENRAQAALARAKTITEIASMKTDKILRVLQFVEQLEKQERQDRDNITEDIQHTSDMINAETQGSFESQVMNQATEQLESTIGGE